MQSLHYRSRDILVKAESIIIQIRSQHNRGKNNLSFYLGTKIQGNPFPLQNIDFLYIEAEAYQEFLTPMSEGHVEHIL